MSFILILIILILLFYLLRRRILFWLLRRLQHFNPEGQRGDFASRETRTSRKQNKNRKRREKVDTKEMMQRHLSKENSQYVDFTEEREEP